MQLTDQGSQRSQLGTAHQDSPFSGKAWDQNGQGKGGPQQVEVFEQWCVLRGRAEVRSIGRGSSGLLIVSRWQGAVSWGVSCCNKLVLSPAGYRGLLLPSALCWGLLISSAVCNQHLFLRGSPGPPA